MKEGFLSQYFVTVAAKRLSAVETDTGRSNQHEYNGSRELKKVLGLGTGEKIAIPTTFIWLGGENEGLSSDGFVTWYDARLDHPKRSEYRLYFPTIDVTQMAQPGDMMFIAKRRDESLMIIIAVAGSTIENQLSWLFGIGKETGLEFTSRTIENGDDKQLDFAVRFILEELGIELEEPEADHLDFLLERFGRTFPSTREFSLYARQTVDGFNALDDPDTTLMAWMEHEEKMFRRMERKIVEDGIKNGFTSEGRVDVDGFMKFSLSIQNTRKSRAGLALENHLEEILRIHKIDFSRFAITENRTKPDFLFPSDKAYHTPAYPDTCLTMLGVKTSCKDRWRQVLAEASRIPEKHLFTLEPGISEHQTHEMKANLLQLVLPLPIHETYKKTQRSWLMSLEEFIGLARERQIRGFETAIL